MISTILEIRDRGTCIPVLAIPMFGYGISAFYVHDKCGYPRIGEKPEVMLVDMQGERPATADPFFWKDRTFRIAHEYIRDHFYDLENGSVVDVEFILGETTIKKKSERETYLKLTGE